MSKVLLKNIGTIVSGDIADTILPGDAILIEDGLMPLMPKRSLTVMAPPSHPACLIRTVTRY